jgi:predicted O-methyltransferase YrrM
MDDQNIKPMRPLTPLYRPDERFEISKTGLTDWLQTESFKRAQAFYSHYPPNSLQSDEARALLHHLIVMQRPERVLEIGTMFAGTTEVMARAVVEAGRGHIDTIDPYGAERCPPLIAAFLPELREKVSFFPQSSAMHFDEVIARSQGYDLVLIDGSHELEFAAFDLDCTARVIRPGGIVVLDNIEQVGPRFATKLFLERHPDWIDVAGVVGLMDPGTPLAEPTSAFPYTKNYVLQAPAHFAVGAVPYSFGTQRSDRGEIDGIDIELARPAHGVLHIQAFVRTFGAGLVHSEELSTTQQAALSAGKGERLRIPLDRPLRTQVAEREGLGRRMEIILAFVGDGGLALKSPPMPYPAKYR